IVYVHEKEKWAKNAPWGTPKVTGRASDNSLRQDVCCIRLLSLVSIFVSAGASGIPNSGLSYTILCLEAVGVPTRFVGLIFTIDWIVGRVQTVNNVMGDAYGAGVINHVSSDLDVLFIGDDGNESIKNGNAN
ncbi:excitatory amino acid transporter-like, partial [Paramuricea clavata]